MRLKLPLRLLSPVRVLNEAKFHNVSAVLPSILLGLLSAEQQILVRKSVNAARMSVRTQEPEQANHGGGSK